MWQSLLRAHSGQETLSRAFWTWGFWVPAILSVIDAFFSKAGANAGIRTIGIALVVLFWLIGMAYSIWATRAVWTCAYNVKNKWWGHLTRAAIVLVWSIFAYELAAYVGEEMSQ